MNTANNVRYAGTDNKIRLALFKILRFKSFDNVTVKDICMESGINRSSFYAHYTDINDLLIRTEQKLSKDMGDILKTSDNTFNLNAFEKLFEFIRENKIFYKAYLRFGVESFVERDMYAKFKVPLLNLAKSKRFFYNESELDYQMRFFGAGLKAMCARWLEKDCRETPAQMAKLIYSQYANNAKFFLDIQSQE